MSTSKNKSLLKYGMKRSLIDNQLVRRKKRSAAIAIEDLIKVIKDFSGITEKLPEELENIFKSVKTEVPIFDNLLKGMTVEKNAQGMLLLKGDLPINKFEHILKEADLVKLVETLKLPIVVGTEDIAAFRTLIGETPQRIYRDLEIAIEENKSIYPQFNLTIEQLELAPQNIKEEIAAIDKKLITWSQGLKLGTVIGAFTIAAGWIRRETNLRKGCHMLTIFNGKSTSCKVSEFSCNSNITTEENKCSLNINAKNITLVMIAIANLENTNTIKIDAANKLNIPVDQLESKLSELIDTRYSDLIQFVNNLKTIPQFSVCEVKNDKVEGGRIPPCRMCNASANPTSTEYIDPNIMGTNFTFQCISNPSILDIITEAVIASGQQLFDIGKNIFNTIKWGAFIVLAVIVFIVILYIISLFTKITSSNKKSDVPVKNSEISYVYI